jgi:diadenosine tetraphosphatase ApaH/serine/threonine PP2A family protein phosphatase
VRYAVLADVHANEPALDAVLADAGARGVDGLLCLGDVVGYGADPGPVLERVAERALVVVAGNHDHAAAGLMDLAWFNTHARRAAEWTAARLAPRWRRYLAERPLSAERDGALLVHASPREPAAWPYLVSAEDGAEALSAFAGPLCFVGHSHLPATWTAGAGGRVVHRPGGGRLALRGGARHVVNVGSVGQPRDGDSRAAYALWDVAEGWVEVRRVAYDAAEARRRIHAAGLPRYLGDRLLEGR